MVGYLQLPDGSTVDVADGLILGRQSACAVVLKDHKASRRHAQLIVAGPVVEIEDLGSSNGTLLNDKSVKRRMLRDGDVVQIGTTRITYREGVAQSRATVVDRQPPVQEPPVQREPPAQREPAVVHEPELDVEVLEFADDEVVHVPKAVAKPDRPRPVSAAAQIPHAPMARAIVIPKRDGNRFGMIADDLRQMSLPMRLWGIVMAVAFACGLGYLAYKLASK